MKILLFHEYPFQANEGMMDTLQKALEDCLPGTSIRFKHGLINTYKPGGIRISRLVNMAYLFTFALFWLLRERPTWAVTVTTPPMIQIWLAMCCRFSGTNLVCWMMDNHPEIEARIIEQLWWGRHAATFLRRINRFAIRRMALVVALDEAMAEVIRQQVPEVPILVHPTWDTQGSKSPGRVACHETPCAVTLLYAGNLGLAHELEPMERLLLKVKRKGLQIRLLVTGGSKDGNERFQAMAKRLSCRLTLRERLNFEILRSLCDEQQVQMGVVLMKTMARGLISPSKFSAYLSLGLPVLHLGPNLTNADMVCRHFGAGLSLAPDAPESFVTAAAEQLCDPRVRRKWWEAVPAAAQFFGEHNAESLATLLVRFMQGEPVINDTRVLQNFKVHIGGAK